MAKSLKVNFILNFLYTASGVVFPLLTFPYASRVMGPEGIGIINFQQSFINYLALFATLGIPMYGIREVARVREDKERLRTTTQELLLIAFVLTLLSYIAVAVLAFAVPQLGAHRDVFLILSLIVGFTAMGCEWFYQGMEDFKFIALRGTLIRIASVVLLFVFVRSKDDLIFYALYTAFATVGNSLFNFLHLRRYGIFSHFSLRALRPQRHLRAVLRIFVLTLITTVYLNLAQMMLGFLKDETAVGYFTAAQKLVNLVMMLIATLGTVMLPRLSHLVETGERDAFDRLAQRATDLTLSASLPLVVGLMLLAAPLVTLFCGAEFVPSVLALQLLSPIVLFVSFSNLLGIQILYPLGKEKLVILSTLAGVCVNVVLNLWLIHSHAHLGTAVAVLATEFAVVCSQFWLGRRYFHLRLFTAHTLTSLVAAGAMAGACLSVMPYAGEWTLIVVPLVGALTYVAALLLLRNALAVEMCGLVRQRLHL